MSICDSCKNGDKPSCYHFHEQPKDECNDYKSKGDGMSICDRCKKNLYNKLGGYCQYELYDDEYCKGFEKLTNRDMLERKIHEMSNEELMYFVDMFGMAEHFNYKEPRGRLLEWFSQPYEEEKKYVVYRINNDTTERIYYATYLDKATTSPTSYSADNFTLQEANKKRNELNNENPTDNWMIEEI